MEKLDEYIAYDKYTKEMVKYVRKQCQCSHTIYFYKNEPIVCGICGRTVYPTKECEFKEKMKMKLRKELKK